VLNKQPTNTLQSPYRNQTGTYSTLADSRSCGPHGRSFGHAWLHP